VRVLDRELVFMLAMAEISMILGPSIIFQGGTAIRIFLGGTRTSEDLDFYIKPQAVHRLGGYLQKAASTLAQDLSCLSEITLDSYRLRQKDQLATGWVVFSYPGKRGKTRVKLEFFNPEDYFKKIHSSVHLLTEAPFVKRNIQRFSLVLDRLSATVRVETPEGILADKIAAILARSYVKGRDFWDLWFLTQVLGVRVHPEEVKLRRKIYGVSEWLRSTEFGGEGWPPKDALVSLLDSDLSRFLKRGELESLRRENYQRLLESVQLALKTSGEA